MAPRPAQTAPGERLSTSPPRPTPHRALHPPADPAPIQRKPVLGLPPPPRRAHHPRHQARTRSRTPTSTSAAATASEASSTSTTTQRPDLAGRGFRHAQGQTWEIRRGEFSAGAEFRLTSSDEFSSGTRFACAGHVPRRRAGMRRRGAGRAPPVHSPPTAPPITQEETTAPTVRRPSTTSPETPPRSPRRPRPASCRTPGHRGRCRPSARTRRWEGPP